MNRELKKRLHDLGILPVVKLEDASLAVQLGKALRAGGINGAEITFRTDQAVPALQALRQAFPDMLLAAGTVLNVEQAKAAKEAGADLLVSPGIDPEILDWAKKNDMPVLPGCSSASDVMVAANHGLDAVKLFPAEAAGGLPLVRALSGPFPTMQFVPSGGIGRENVSDWLKEPQVLAASGSWMVTGNDPAAVAALADEAMKTVLELKLAHIGINADNETQAHRIAQFFETVFGFGARENPASIFSDTYVEILKSPYLGQKGHIAISTPDVERAVAYLENKGIVFNKESTVLRESGCIQAIYLEQEIGGFAIHLVRKG